MANYSTKGKSIEELLKDMQEQGSEKERFEAMGMAIRARIADQLHDAMAKTTEGFIRMAGELTRKIDELKNSIDIFRQSSERASRALNFFTAIIGGVAVLQLILFLVRK